MAPVLGLILAGGLGRRMGGADKALLRLGDRTLLDRVAERLAPHCVGLALSANGDPARFEGFLGPILPDGVPGHSGPLAGILAGLDHAAERHPEVRFVVSASGDAPFLPDDLVPRLLEAGRRGGIAVAASGEREHFTVALWPVSLRDDLRAALIERGERRVGAFIARHQGVPVRWPAEPVDPFLNVNTPEDLERAARIAAGTA